MSKCDAVLIDACAYLLANMELKKSDILEN